MSPMEWFAVCVVAVTFVLFCAFVYCDIADLAAAEAEEAAR